jgi:hypothetical protein
MSFCLCTLIPMFAPKDNFELGFESWIIFHSWRIADQCLAHFAFLWCMFFFQRYKYLIISFIDAEIWMYCWSRIKNIIYCILVLYSLSNQTHTSLPEVNEFLFIHQLCLGVLVVEEAGENHRPWASNCQELVNFITCGCELSAPFL